MHLGASIRIGARVGSMVSRCKLSQASLPSRERKMLGALFAVGTEGVISSVMGDTTLPAYRGHLNYLTCPISGTK